MIFEIWQKGKFSKMSELGQVYTAGQFVESKMDNILIYQKKMREYTVFI